MLSLWYVSWLTLIYGHKIIFIHIFAYTHYIIIHMCAAAAAKSLQSRPTLCDPIDGSPRGSPVLGISPGKNTGVGCHFLLQCMKVKSESEVAQSCLTLSDPMDCSPPGCSVHGIFQARVLEWGDTCIIVYIFKNLGIVCLEKWDNIYYILYYNAICYYIFLCLLPF